VLRSNLLAARAGLLRNYDPLVLQINAIYGSLDRLRDIAIDEPRLRAAVDQLTNVFERQELTIEQFKSDNALVQNSLTHFARIGRSLELRAERPPFRRLAPLSRTSCVSHSTPLPTLWVKREIF